MDLWWGVNRKDGGYEIYILFSTRKSVVLIMSLVSGAAVIECGGEFSGAEFCATRLHLM